MGASFVEVRDALADACRVLPEMNVYPNVPKSVVVPAIVLQPGDPVIVYRGRACVWTFEVLLVLGQASDQAAAEKIVELVSPDSPLVTAINTAFLDGGVTEARIGEVPIGAARYASGLLTVTAHR